MARNVEIKARVQDLPTLEAKIAALTDAPAVIIAQDDTFFDCSAGRLKLRRLSPDVGELIFYRRDDRDGPTPSFYEIAATHAPDTLGDVLSAAYGEVGRVVKHRRLYLLGRSRVHVDRVQGLGDFMEIEVVLAEEEPDEAGYREARALMAALGVTEEALVDCAYVDLLQQQRQRIDCR